MSTNTGAQQLDHLLSHWENICFVHSTSEMNHEQLVNEQHHKNFDAFRKSILGADKKIYQRRICEEILPPTSRYYQKIGTNVLIPFSVLSWNMSSRRIFHLNSDIQNLLDATSIKTLTWADLKFPFDSFLITLDDVLKTKNGPTFDTILVSKVGHILPDDFPTRDSEMWELRLLPPGLSNCKRLSKSIRKKMIRLRLNGDSEGKINDIWEKHLSYDKDEQMILPTMYFYPDEAPNAGILETLSHGVVLDQRMPLKDFAINSAFHIMINLCVYLENYPSSAQSKVPSKKNGSRKKRIASENAFVDQVSDIFKVTCKFKMQKDIITKMVDFVKSSKAVFEKRAHWRRAHWRRKPYCGKIPLKIAPKDWIPMRLINRHRLPDKTLPIATEAMM